MVTFETFKNGYNVFAFDFFLFSFKTVKTNCIYNFFRSSLFGSRTERVKGSGLGLSKKNLPGDLPKINLPGDLTTLIGTATLLISACLSADSISRFQHRLRLRSRPHGFGPTLLLMTISIFFKPDPGPQLGRGKGGNFPLLGFKFGKRTVLGYQGTFCGKKFGKNLS